MITPHHLILNSALGRRFWPQLSTRAVLAGALFPDILVWLYFLWYGVLQRVPETLLWGDLYFKSAWNGVFCLAHSFWLLPLLTLLAAIWRKPWWLAFFASASFHALCDFLVHHSDAYRHFYPFSDWIFRSPVSYWEPAHFGRAFGIFEALLGLACLLYWWRKTNSRRSHLGLAVLISLELLFLGQGLFALGLHSHLT